MMQGRLLLVGALVAGLTLSAPVAGTARAADGGSGAPTIPSGAKWQPYRSQPFTTTAGQLCPFPLAGEPVRDEERVAVLDTFADGSPRKEVYLGELVFRYTNLDTGASAEYDLSGIMFVVYGTDGSMLMTSIGPVGFGFRPTDRYPAGSYVFDGYHVVYTAPQRAYREVRVDHGTEHDICADLA